MTGSAVRDRAEPGPASPTLRSSVFPSGCVRHSFAAAACLSVEEATPSGLDPMPGVHVDIFQNPPGAAEAIWRRPGRRSDSTGIISPRLFLVVRGTLAARGRRTTI